MNNFFQIFQTKSLIKNGFSLLKQSGRFSKLSQISSSAELAVQLWSSNFKFFSAINIMLNNYR